MEVLLRLLDLTDKQVAVVAVNSQHAAFDRTLQAGDSVAVYPPVAGG